MGEFMRDPKYGTAAEIMALDWARLMAILEDPDATVFAKAKACQRLAVVGNHFTVGAIAPLLADPQLAHYARFALEPAPAPAADQALREAAGRLKGRLLVGVINSIGMRRDPEAIPLLGRLVNDADPEVARAAVEALARIRPPL